MAQWGKHLSCKCELLRFRSLEPCKRWIDVRLRAIHAQAGNSDDLNCKLWVQTKNSDSVNKVEGTGYQTVPSSHTFTLMCAPTQVHIHVHTPYAPQKRKKKYSVHKMNSYIYKLERTTINNLMYFYPFNMF